MIDDFTHNYYNKKTIKDVNAYCFYGWIASYNESA